MAPRKESTKKKWIDANTETPENNNPVLVLHMYKARFDKEAKLQVGIAQYFTATGGWIAFEGGSPLNVYYWNPIPDTPVDVTKDKADEYRAFPNIVSLETGDGQEPEAPVQEETE